MRKLTLYVAFSILFCALSNAQNKMPSALDQLATQCQQVIELNDTINARQARLDDLKWQLEEIKQSWWQICNDALSSPNCDENETRLSTIDELISLTDPNYEADILAQLKDAKNNPAIRALKTIGQSTSTRGKSTSQRTNSRKDKTQPREQATKPDLKPGGESNAGDKDETGNKDKTVTPVIEEQPKEEQDVKKDNSSTPPESKDSKKNQVVNPEQQKNKGQKDKTKIESKNENNRDKTIKAVKDKLNKNK